MLGKYQEVAGQRPRLEKKSFKMGKITFCLSIPLSTCQPVGSKGQPEGFLGQPGGYKKQSKETEDQTEGSEGCADQPKGLRASWRGLKARRRGLRGCIGPLYGFESQWRWGMYGWTY